MYLLKNLQSDEFFNLIGISSRIFQVIFTKDYKDVLKNQHDGYSRY